MEPTEPEAWLLFYAPLDPDEIDPSTDLWQQIPLGLPDTPEHRTYMRSVFRGQPIPRRLVRLPHPSAQWVDAMDATDPTALESMLFDGALDREEHEVLLDDSVRDRWIPEAYST